MKCFKHPESEAVGTCKQCSKGMCPACAKDIGMSIVCSTECEAATKLIRTMVEQNKVVYPIAAKTHTRNGLMFALMGFVFLLFAIVQIGTVLSVFTGCLGLVMLIGSVFYFANGRKYAKLAKMA